MKDNLNHVYDDGLYLPINKDKKKLGHVTFYCRTLNQESESCDFKMFNLDPKTSKYNKQKKLTQVS